MNLLKPDSPPMQFLSTLADIIILNLLFVICSIPVVTFGAAFSAKYYVAMKIMKGEDSGVIVPFFKAFKRNFRQATVVWFILIIGIALILLDWRWVIVSGWSTTPFFYKFGVIVMSVFVWLMTITIFPLIARYEMKISELFKGALILIIIRFIPLILVTLFMIASVIACIWYSQWFPLIYVFCSTAITYFLCRVFIKQFDKLEKNQSEKAQDAEGQSEGTPEEGEWDYKVDTALEADGGPDAAPQPAEDKVLSEDMDSTALAKSKMEAKDLEEDLDKPQEDAEEDKSGNKLTRFIRQEKKNMRGLSSQQKVVYFVRHYLPAILVVVLAITAIAWYASDIYKSKMNVVSGGLINAAVSDEGRKYATTDFLAWGGYGKGRTAELLDTDLNFKNDLDYQERYLDIAFRASILTGAYDYLIMREDAVYNYSTPDYFQDLSELLDISKFSESDLYYYEPTDKEKENGADDERSLLAVKLTDEIKQNLGLSPDHTYYIAFAYPNASDDFDNYTKFIEYLFGDK